MSQEQQSLTEIQDIAEQEAENLRSIHKLGIRGIKNVFTFIEQNLGYLLIRYPFGEDSLQGFAATHYGERLIVTNSSERLGRENFTAAHELGHHIFDISEQSPKLIHDNHTGNFNSENIQEYRADCFAANFLMPREGIYQFIKDIGKKHQEIDNFDIIKLQEEYGVSHTAMIRRLKVCEFITQQTATQLYSYYEHHGESLTGLFRRANVKTDLLNRSEIVQVPTKYMKFLGKNYEDGYIPYFTVEQVLKKVKLTPAELGFKEEKKPHEEEIDLDDLLAEFED
jgi:Zn-dependent peptidase ImmA (M78 family)